MQLIVRRMTREDLAGVLEVERASFSEPWSYETFCATLLLPYAFYYVAEIVPPGVETEQEQTAEHETGTGHLSHRMIVGQCGVRDIFGEGEITNVSVLPAFRGRGISRKMLEMLIAESKERGTGTFTLEVRAGNIPAVRLYESLGFRAEGIRRNFYRDPEEDALIMWKRETEEGKES